MGRVGGSEKLNPIFDQGGNGSTGRTALNEVESFPTYTSFIMAIKFNILLF